MRPAPSPQLTLGRLLELARERLDRLNAEQAVRAISDGAVLVDIRSESQRERDGVVPGSIFVPRNQLEWRCAPSSASRDERLSDPALLVILMCDEGYQSSLAAATLQLLGLTRATELVGGFRAWVAAGLAVDVGAEPVNATAPGVSRRAPRPGEEFGQVARG